MQNYRLNTTEIPTYLNGKFTLYKIKQTDDDYPIEYIKVERLNNKPIKIFFKELSISDRNKFDAKQRDINLSFKIRIPQTKQIDSLCVLKINEEYYKVFNAYHFTNKAGYPETDLTLEDYSNVKLEEDL